MGGTATLEPERRMFAGCDRRSDRTLVGERYLINGTNLLLDQGVLRSRKGDVLWGTLNANALPGTYRSLFAVDVGNVEWLLLHKGSLIYAGVQGGVWTTVAAIQGGNMAAADLESDWEFRGYTIGSGGLPVFRVLFKQATGCRILEFNGVSWVGMNAGIGNTAAFSLSQIAGGSNQPTGAYRVRITAYRSANGVKTSESAPVGLNSSTSVDLGYQEIELTAGTNRIQAIINDPSPDPQITHYGAQVTRNLVFSGDTEYSSNGNDPTLYFEAQSVARAAFPLALVLDVSDLAVPCPDLLGYLPLPGHLISVTTGDIVFFASEYTPLTPYQSRVYYTAISGGPQHRELYDPTEFIDAATGDGKLLTGLGMVSDHLVVFKENKTGILPNRDTNSKVIWPDTKIGISHRKCFANITENEIVALCHDGIVRRYDGRSWDRRQDLADSGGVEFSEAIKPETRRIDPGTVDWVYHDERLHLFYTDTGVRRAWVLHPRDGMGWMPWTTLTHHFNAVVSNGLQWIFLNTVDGRLYEQSPLDEVYTQASQAGALVAGSVTPAHLFPKNRKNTIELWRCAVEGEFARLMSGGFRGNQGETEPATVSGTPDPELPINQYVNLFELQAVGVVWGNHIEHALNWIGRTVIRSWNFEVQEVDGGGSGWSSAVDTPGYNFLPTHATNALLDLRFESDSAEVLDYSGRRRHHVWDPAASGLRAFLPGMIPGGGHEVVGALGSGYECPTWDGLDNFNAGLLVTPMTFEAEVGFDSLAQSAVLVEAGNGNDFWRWQVNANGAIEFQVHTAQLNWRYQTAPGVVTASDSADYFVQFVLSNGGFNGQFYCGPRIGPTAAILTNRTVL